tara:strand:- start:197 stop:484 length:288 start_codon:yes stop_codon:yes gene_type:complete
MGYAYSIELPASGTGNPIPINVVGQTIFGGESVVQFAYDVANFDTNQYATMNIAQGQAIFHFAHPTVLWVRQDPALVGAPATNFSVWTDIGSVNV